MRTEALRPFPTWPTRWSPLGGDLLGGVTVAMLTLVSTVSYAAVAAAPLGASQAGAAIASAVIGTALGGALASALGSVPTQVFAPRASVAVVTASAITAFAGPAAHRDGTTVIGLTTACLLLAAMLQWLYGALRLGRLIRLVPHPVTAGFSVGIGVEMVAAQLPHLLGGAASAGLPAAAPIAVAASTVAGIVWARRRRWAGSDMLVGLATGIAVHLLMGRAFGHVTLPTLQPIALEAVPLQSIGPLADALRAGAWFDLAPQLAAYALVISVVNSLETLTSAVAVEDLTHGRFDADRALAAGALGSLAAVCVGGLPVGGGTASSVANTRAGARTRWSGVVGAVALIALVGACRGWLDAVPAAAMSGLMIAVAFGLVHGPLAETVQSWRASPSRDRHRVGDLAVTALVCALMVSSGILTAVAGGVAAATASIVLQMRRTLVRRHCDASDPALAGRIGFTVDPVLGRSVQVFDVCQPLFFATAELLMHRIEKIDRSARFVIMDLTHGATLDATAGRMLARCSATLRSRGQEMIIVAGSDDGATDMQALPCRVFLDLSDALRFATAPPAAEPPAPLRSPDTWNDTMVRPARQHLSLVTAPAEALPAAAIEPARVDQAARALALFVGPVAKVLAVRAAARCASLDELYRQLALELETPEEREEFLRHKPDEPREAAVAPARPVDGPDGVPAAPAPLAAGLALTPEVLEQATTDLSIYLGPLSKLLVARAHAKALDREHLYRLLARQLSSAEQRETFLRAAGIPLRPFDLLQR